MHIQKKNISNSFWKSRNQWGQVGSMLSLPFPPIWNHALKMFRLVWNYLERVSSFWIRRFHEDAMKSKDSRKIFVELENHSLLKKHSNHFKNIKTSLKNDLFHICFMNNALYFASKCLKSTFEKSHIKSGPSIMALYEVFIKHDPIGPIFYF